jgi:DNA-3-methyladenine glycosylase I
VSDLLVGADGRARCAWAGSAPEYVDYHDQEWGRAVHGDAALFERLTLEAFQSGLSWLTILRKRENFRAAFAGFEIEAVAAFTDADRARLLADAGIVRNSAKIDAAIANAQAAAALRAAGGAGALDELIWSFRPDEVSAPRRMADMPSAIPESAAMAKELKRHGFVFVGPTTMYALMQAVGMVNDHLTGCHTRAG